MIYMQGKCFQTLQTLLGVYLTSLFSLIWTDVRRALTREESSFELTI